MDGSPDEAEKLKSEWARAQGFGRALGRKRLVATMASVITTGVVVLGGYVVLFVLWPFDKIPVLYLAIPWLPALPLGWFVRNKLWPKGQFA